MTDSLRVNSKIDVMADAGAASVFESPAWRPRLTDLVQLTFGNGAGKANMIHADQHQVTGSTTLILNGSIVGGVPLKDVFGGDFSVTALKVIWFKNLSTTGRKLVIGGDPDHFASFGADTDGLDVPAGVSLVLQGDTMDYAVATPEGFVVQAPDGTTAFQIALIGEG